MEQIKWHQLIYVSWENIIMHSEIKIDNSIIMLQTVQQNTLL